MTRDYCGPLAQNKGSEQKKRTGWMSKVEAGAFIWLCVYFCLSMHAKSLNSIVWDRGVDAQLVSYHGLTHILSYFHAHVWQMCVVMCQCVAKSLFSLCRYVWPQCFVFVSQNITDGLVIQLLGFLFYILVITNEIVCFCYSLETVIISLGIPKSVILTYNLHITARKIRSAAKL